jgi:hypothetical protein
MTEAFAGPRGEALGSFAATPEGAETAAATTAVRAAELGIERIAHSVRAATVVLVSWLANNGHGGGDITVGMCLDARARELEIRACDSGMLLPPPFESDSLRQMLAATGNADNGVWALQVGRAVWTRLPVPTFAVRYSWSVPAGMIHPTHTFEQCDSEELAEQAAKWALRNQLGACGLVVTEVAVREGDGPWRITATNQDAAIPALESAGNRQATSGCHPVGRALNVRCQPHTAGC